MVKSLKSYQTWTRPCRFRFWSVVRNGFYRIHKKLFRRISIAYQTNCGFEIVFYAGRNGMKPKLSVGRVKISIYRGPPSRLFYIFFNLFVQNCSTVTFATRVAQIHGEDNTSVLKSKKLITIIILQCSRVLYKADGRGRRNAGRAERTRNATVVGDGFRL